MQAMRRALSGGRATAMSTLVLTSRSPPLYRPLLRPSRSLLSLSSRSYARVAFPEVQKEGKTVMQRVWTFTKWCVLLPIGISAAVGLYYRSTFEPRFSAIYLGESKAFEEQMSQELGFDVSVVLPKMAEGLLTMAFGRVLEQVGKEAAVEQKARAAFQAIVDHYPNLFLGYALLAWLERSKCNLSESKRLLTQALHVAETHEEENRSLAHLLPDPATFFVLKQTEEELEAMAQVREVAADVWAVGARYAVPREGPVQDPIFVQATVLRLANGNVVVVNPTHFSARTVAWINSLGRVTDLVTTTMAHGAAVARCKQEVWPEARVYGTSPSSKHDQPLLAFDGFLCSDGVRVGSEVTEAREHFNGEVDVHLLQGHVFEEAVLYHRASGTLTGLTDMLLSPRALDSDEAGSVAWGMHAYAYGLGLDRGSRTGDLVPQSYHLAFCINRRQLWGSVREMQERFRVEHLVLGHGGVLHGRNLCHYSLQKGFKWVGDVVDEVTGDFCYPADALAQPYTWFRDTRLFLFLVKVLGASTAVRRNKENQAELEAAARAK